MSVKGVSPMKKNEKNGGFTLLELLIVIGVIAILASIIIPAFKGMQEEGDRTAAQGDLKAIKLALESYYVHHDRAYPTYITELVTASPRIVSELPDDRFNRGHAYNYINLTDYYCVWTDGPDEKQQIIIDTEKQKILVPKNSDDIYETNAWKELTLQRQAN